MLNGVKMNVIKTAANGKVNSDTAFIFKQEKQIVFAEYSGGIIRKGHLIGTINNNILFFRYVQIDINDIIDSGKSECEIYRTEENKLRLIERFSWESQNGEGENIFQEI